MRFLVLLVVLVVVPACSCRAPGLVSAYDAGCAPETCDGVDEDCNGVIDDHLPNLACGTGECARVFASCVNGVAQTCEPGLPSAETCNGVDDDCDGQIDEGIAPVSCGVGACAVTVTGCERTCIPGAPSAESCDGIDNDCDGTIDDALAALDCGVGQCARTQVACLDGAPQMCTPGAPEVETCNQLDDDCDGQVDEERVCEPPTVMCPASMSTLVASPVTLTASAAPAVGLISQTQWSVITAPGGSNATPISPTASSTAFTPDRGGVFTLRFCATDDRGTSACCTTDVTTNTCSTPPSPPVSTACGTSWDGRPILQFDPVPAGLRYQLSLAGQSLVLASATEGANYLRPQTRIVAGGPMPGAATALEVRACRVGTAACCSSPTALSVSVVEACAAAVAPSSDNLVLSEYITNGEGTCPSTDCVNRDTCQAGEAVEITNLSNCPVSLDGFHFAYRNAAGSTASVRWMNFAAADVVPPRGVYVAIRNRQFAPTCAAQLPPPSAGLFGLRVSSLAMQGANLCSGWFNNTGGGLSELQLAPGSVTTTPNFDPAPTIARVAPYLPNTGSSASCTSIGFDAVDSCGAVTAGARPTASLSPNQLGRLWHPCDAVRAPVPTCVRD